MAFQRYGQHDQSYIADTAAEMANLGKLNMGSSCFVIDEAAKYIINSRGEWIKQSSTLTPATVTRGAAPSLKGYATEKYVDEAIAAANPVKNIYGDAHAFGLMVDASDNKTLIEAMLEKGKVGMYNFHVEKGAPGQPDEVVAKNSSCRGIACVDTYRSDSNWYGWIIMFDQDGEMYTQNIRNAQPSGWKYRG